MKNYNFFRSVLLWSTQKGARARKKYINYYRSKQSLYSKANNSVFRVLYLENNTEFIWNFSSSVYNSNRNESNSVRNHASD